MTTDRRWSAPEPGRTAVVCVECQNGVLGPDSMLPALAADAEPALAVIESLLTGARGAGVLVVHTPFAGRLGGDPGTTPLMRSTAPATAEWRPGHRATQVLPQLLDPSDLIVPRHQGVSPTWGTELLPLLRARKLDTLVFAGVSLNVAIPLAVGQAAHEGFNVVVAGDAVVGTPAEYGRLVLRNTISLLAQVVSVADLTRAWQQAMDLRQTP
ncbi:isochorismatase family protein [Mycolicibacterium monacense]|uniref:Isochorismatase n=2 Tax=Mycobacteriaceae TaxID=1762 RepID=A0AAD1MY22_MYCMB|nr:isochorismatase family protein [Mycolicibacterium monacense]MDA4104749.1 cysteine hydrolase [Mycolicibacterium monacense DSM 44395]ORB22771.1 cysteine hydrolase [Mycolicibacterium monacense DSM 44395]QHP87658.1 isochorismatase family protein [Mycolicibacterium monacense DSM 44395]BBZ59181.1 isochorismatase [Mycolicibacterium monacense]